MHKNIMEQLFTNQLQTYTKSINLGFQCNKKKDICDNIASMSHSLILEDFYPL